MYKKAQARRSDSRCAPLLFAYALAVMEENAGGGIVVTAPTCGSCGVVPSVISYIINHLQKDTTEDEIINALATAGLVGNVVKTNASISGAEVGCQGEVGTASSMAAAAAAYLMGGTPHQIENAAEMAMEHFLGLTCDPVEGLVQIPCIERNAFAATRAIDAAEYALLGDGRHRVSFDEVVLTMKLTGIDIEECYRETAKGGLASTYNLDEIVEKEGVQDFVDTLVSQKLAAMRLRSMSNASQTSVPAEIIRRQSIISEKVAVGTVPVHC
eukprot:comp22309_c0_seq3/m.33127 comp22309_c0_seq3/g.33127  ORF comp22309_c0_seq3/g.33127 comp22309_c0_seq3/m.33127 type:complete len:270 (-) comp22309_c0_seq3:31-840(-)